MAALSRSIQGPWVVGGNFNAVVELEERRGTRDPDRTSMTNFAEAIHNSGLLDAGFVGWNICPILSLTMSCFDCHFLANSSPKSDRSDSSGCGRCDSFQQLIKKAWEGECATQPMLNVHLKLKKTKQLLKVWNKEVFGNIFHQIHRAKEELEILDNRMQNAPNDDLLQDSLAVKQRLEQLELMEEVFWKQSRNSWLDEGDSSTKYFHTSAREIIRRATITSIKTKISDISSGQDEIKVAAVKYFEELFQAEPATSQSDFI
ncbi:uncharacterized protein LOC131249718 [Magnolia sinica]|uniref:uncharacterized protein LOC131249718 n=1 Tax=Magnolia sinica TaxID=86752 RepID=UPI002657E28A|nr:uncharacterized protein LOC131249718 [Magnolia sinica]